MSENAVRVGRRIRSLREERGWTQGELANRLGRTQTAISYWEAGRRAPGIDDLLDLAHELGVPPAEILSEGRPRPRPVPALLRAVAEQVDATQLGEELEDFACASARYPAPRMKWRVAPGSPRDTAEALLAAAGITKPPIRIAWLLAGCGVRVLLRDFADVDGLVIELDDGPAIGINRAQGHARRRFTAAHELGHHLLRHIDRYHVDFGGDLSPAASGEHPGYDWRVERAANDFAANLLMPAGMVRAAWVPGSNIKRLADIFQVSAAAAGFRLTNLGLR